MPTPATPEPTSRTLDYDGAATYLGTTKRHVQKLVATGELTHVKLGQRLVRFLPEHLDRYLEAQTRAAAS